MHKFLEVALPLGMTVLIGLAIWWVLRDIRRQFVDQKQPKMRKEQLERLRYWKFMRQLGYKDWMISEEYSNITSLKDLTEINNRLEKCLRN